MCVSIWYAGMHVCSHSAWVTQMQCTRMWRSAFDVRYHPVSHSIHWHKVSHLNPKLSDWIILLSSLPWGCLPSTENRSWLPHLPCINTVLGTWALVLLSAQQMLYLLSHLPYPSCILYSWFHISVPHTDHYLSGGEENFKRPNCEVYGISADVHICHVVQMKTH